MEIANKSASFSRSSALLGVALLVFLTFSASARAQDWTRFRGPNGTGVSAATGVPDRDLLSKVVWKMPTPPGRSSPVLANDRIYLTATGEDRLDVLALHPQTGIYLWKHTVFPRRHPKRYPGNDSATPTPVTDGSHVFVFFPDAGLIALDRWGARLWEQDLGDYSSFYGLAASPILAGESLLVVLDGAKDSKIVALDKASGSVLWSHDRPDRIDSFATPVLYPSSDNPLEILIHGAGWLDGYSVESGQLLWSQPAVGAGPVGSPLLVDQTLVLFSPNGAEEPIPPWSTFSGATDTDKDGRLTLEETPEGWGEHFGRLDANDDGFATKAEWDELRDAVLKASWGTVALDLGQPGTTRAVRQRWRSTTSTPYIPTPVAWDGTLFLVKEGGILTTLDMETGKVVKRGRLDRSAGEIWASPVAAEGRVYVATTSGKIFVVKGVPEWEVVSVADLGEEINATPAIAQGRLIVRTDSHLYAFGQE